MIIEMVMKIMKIDLDFMVIKQATNNDYLTYNIKYPDVMIFINNTNSQSLPNIHFPCENLLFKSKLYRSVDLMSQQPFVTTVVNCPK
jgi:hypothetical protein